MSIRRTPLNYAITYEKRGWRVLPLHSVVCGDCTCGRDTCSSPGKHPRTKNGAKDATTDLKQIVDWWAAWPDTNVGIATDTPLFVIDVDLAKGASLEDLHRYNFVEFSDTLTAETGSGGLHYYLSCDGPLFNTAGKLAPFIR